MKTHKIVQLTTVHPRYDVRIYHKECLTLAEHGFDVSLIVADGKGCEIKDNINIIDIGKAKNRATRMLFSSIKLLFKALACDAKVYHFHDPELIIVGAILRVFGKNVIYDVHEDVPKSILSKHWIPEKIRGIVSSSIRIIENLFSRTFSGIVTATPTIGERFEKLNKNSIAVKNYPKLSEIATYANRSIINNQICYIGLIAKIRGILEILDAINGLDVKLCLAGTFESTALKQLCQAKESWNQVEDYGFQNRAGVYNIMNSSMLGLVILHPEPNYLEAIATKLFEYMAAGLPVIASNFPLWQAVIDEYQCGICVDPLNINQIQHAIVTLLNNPDEAAAMGQRGREAVLNHYNWEIEAKSLVKLYENIIMA